MLVLMTILSHISSASFLCSLNGRTPNISGNGVGYNNLTDSEFQNGDSNLYSAGYYNVGAKLNPTPGPLFSLTILLTLLTSSVTLILFCLMILKLTKNVESICNLARIVNSSNERSLSSHNLSPDTNTS